MGILFGHNALDHDSIFDSVLPGDEEGRIYLTHWLFGGGEHLDKIDDPMWSQYMMAAPRMKGECERHLEEDAKARARGENTSSEVFITFHMDMRVSGYRTGYELLHQSDPNSGDFNILGGAIVTHSDNGDVTIRYLVKYRWNEVAHVNPKEWVDRVEKGLAKVAATSGGAAVGCGVGLLVGGHAPFLLAGAAGAYIAYKKTGTDFHMAIVWHAESTITVAKDGASIRSKDGWPFE